MAAPLIAGLPPRLQLPAGYVIRVTALDPTTGATVSGVTVSDVSVFATDLGSAADGDTVGPLLVPSVE